MRLFHRPGPRLPVSCLATCPSPPQALLLAYHPFLSGWRIPVVVPRLLLGSLIMSTMRCHVRWEVLLLRDMIQSEIFWHHTSVKCAEMWRQSHSCNHSTMKYSTVSPLLQVEKRGWIWRQGGFWTPEVTEFFDVRVTHVTPWPIRASTQLRSSKSKKTRRRGYTSREWWM